MKNLVVGVVLALVLSYILPQSVKDTLFVSVSYFFAFVIVFGFIGLLLTISDMKFKQS